ncbi:MAG: hypothetical protein ACLRFR_02950 [Clostridia bacterium]
MNKKSELITKLKNGAYRVVPYLALLGPGVATIATYLVAYGKFLDYQAASINLYGACQQADQIEIVQDAVANYFVALDGGTSQEINIATAKLNRVLYVHSDYKPGEAQLCLSRPEFDALVAQINAKNPDGAAEILNTAYDNAIIDNAYAQMHLTQAGADTGYFFGLGTMFGFGTMAIGMALTHAQEKRVQQMEEQLKAYESLYANKKPLSPRKKEIIQEK